MGEVQPAGGNALVYAKIRDPGTRSMVWHQLLQLPGERATATIYELDTQGWGDHEWEDALGKLTLDLDPDNDVLIIWRIIEGRLVRECIAGRYA